MQTKKNFRVFFCAAFGASLLLAASTEARGEAAQVRLLRRLL